MGTETTSGVKVHTYLKLSNLGPVVIKYTWRKEPAPDPFGTKHYAVPHIAFDESDGMLLPNETVSFLFVLLTYAHILE